MSKPGNPEIDAIFQRCSQFFGEMKRMCDNFLTGKNTKSRGSRRMGMSRKAQRDPNAPKKPITAYILYFKDRKQVYVENNQNMPITDITKLIGREWKELPKEKQQYYVEKAKKDKERYRKELEKYKALPNPELEPKTETVEKNNSRNKKKLHKLSEIKKEDSEEEVEEVEEVHENEHEIEEEEANDEEVEEKDDEEEQEDEEEEEEEDDEKEESIDHNTGKNAKTKRGNFLATSSDNDFDEKIKKKVKK